MKMKLSEDKELVQEVLRQLKENKEKYGERYCPCVNPKYYIGDKYICPCEEFRNCMPVGEECHCGLYIKIEN